MRLKAFDFIIREPVLLISLLLAVVSAFFCPPSAFYISYIDFRVLALLLCLMLVVAGCQETGLFYRLGLALSQKAKSVRSLTLILTALCFFTSMFITNDVALITFVPFTISVFSFSDSRDKLIFVIVAETIAANFGSMLTPVGNPQNLYLFSLSKMSVADFVLEMLPLFALSAVMIAVMILLRPNNSFCMTVTHQQHEKSILKIIKFWVFLALFLICIANVLHLIPYQAVLVIVLLTVLAVDRKLFIHADYSLLLTFVCLFIFIGNIGQIPQLKQLLSQILGGREIIVSALLSQIISNVPAAMLLSGFTQNYSGLMWGVNIGGAGTLIASMASLISYKYYAAVKNADKGKYIKTFTVYNVIFLAVLLLFAVAVR